MWLSSLRKLRFGKGGAGGKRGDRQNAKAEWDASQELGSMAESEKENASRPDSTSDAKRSQLPLRLADTPRLENIPGVNPVGADRRAARSSSSAANAVEDRSRIVVNSTLELHGIPEEAYGCIVNGRSAIEWIMDRYQVRTDKDSGIVNDPNKWGEEHGNPRSRDSAML